MQELLQRRRIEQAKERNSRLINRLKHSANKQADNSCSEDAQITIQRERERERRQRGNQRVNRRKAQQPSNVRRAKLKSEKISGENSITPNPHNPPPTRQLEGMRIVAVVSPKNRASSSRRSVTSSITVVNEEHNNQQPNSKIKRTKIINRRVEHEEDEVKKVARTRRRSARTVILEARERKRQEKLLKVKKRRDQEKKRRVSRARMANASHKRALLRVKQARLKKEEERKAIEAEKQRRRRLQRRSRKPPTPEPEPDPNAMNIDNMDYDALLALGDQMGKVNRGLDKAYLQLFPITSYEAKLIQQQKEKNPNNAIEIGIVKLVEKKIIEQCAVCREEFELKSVCRSLLCSHYFHQVCIDKWLEYKPTCPICLKDMRM